MRKFIFYRELIELTCEYKTPQPGEKEFHYTLKDMKTGVSFSDDSLPHIEGSYLDEGNPPYPSEYTEKDKQNMRQYIEFVAEEKGITIEDRLESMCKKRPFWKTYKFWSLVVAIIAAIAAILALFV